MSALWQLVRLPATLLEVRRIIREDCSVAAADEHLWALRGFHVHQQDPHYRARSWEKVALRDIGPADVRHLDVSQMAFMMQVAMEIEDPIVEYSHQNGEGFRVLLPALARFMGRSEAEAAYARSHGLPWCESAWCAEERRHGNAFARAIERLTREAPARDNPNAPRAITADENEALRHLVGREGAEWASSSTYVVMAAHASGSLHTLLRNLARDEIKHLCILSAADVYLRGPRPWSRFVELVKVGLANYRDQRAMRSGGRRIGAHRVTAIEVVAAHLLMEGAVRRWLAVVPLRTLTTVFETAPAGPELGPGQSQAEQPRVQAQLAASRERRIGLSRWAPRARRLALDRRRGDDTDAGLIADIVARDLGGFAGAEIPGSRCARTLCRRIARSQPARLRAGLRDYQIRHNRHARGRAGGPDVGPEHAP